MQSNIIEEKMEQNLPKAKKTPKEKVEKTPKEKVAKTSKERVAKTQKERVAKTPKERVAKVEKEETRQSTSILNEEVSQVEIEKVEKPKSGRKRKASDDLGKNRPKEKNTKRVKEVSGNMYLDFKIEEISGFKYICPLSRQEFKSGEIILIKLDPYTTIYKYYNEVNFNFTYEFVKRRDELFVQVTFRNKFITSIGDPLFEVSS